MGFCDEITADKVNDPTTFAEYACQRTGTPWPTANDMMILRKQLKIFFAKYPHLDYSTLVKVVDWCRANRKRFSSVYKIIYNYRYAWKAGAIPEFNQNQYPVEVDKELLEAFAQESDKDWRLRLAAASSGAISPDAARKVYQEWKEKVAL